MTELILPNEATEVEYVIGDTLTDGPFTIPFSFFDADDIKVATEDDDGVITDLVNVTDFTVSGTAVDNGFDGGTLTLVVEVQDVTLKVYRDIVIDRVSNLPTTGPFSMDQLNTDLNKLTAIAQELKALRNKFITLDENALDSSPWDLSSRAAGSAGEGLADTDLATNRQVDASGPNFVGNLDAETYVGATNQWSTLLGFAGIEIQGAVTPITKIFDLLTDFYCLLQNRDSSEAEFYIRYRYQVDCYALVSKVASNIYPIKIPGSSALPFSFKNVSQDIDYFNGNCTVFAAVDIYPLGADSAQLYMQLANMTVNTSEPR